jgi:K+-transporting ATPase A subunit
MHWGTTAWLQLLVVVAILGALQVPLGNYMARVYSGESHWRVERFVYRMAGVNPDREQNWIWYLVSVLAFSAVSIVALWTLLIGQTQLPQPWGHQGMTPLLALNTAVSFVTNTSWQNYAGESTLGQLGLAAGLGVQAFAGAAVGMAVAIALIRGIDRQAGQLGNFWVDLVPGIVRILLPIAIVVALVLTTLGVVESFGAARRFPSPCGLARIDRSRVRRGRPSGSTTGSRWSGGPSGWEGSRSHRRACACRPRR